MPIQLSVNNEPVEDATEVANSNFSCGADCGPADECRASRHIKISTFFRAEYEAEIKPTITPKSRSFDGITTKVLKFMLGEVLLYLVNYPVMSGSFPKRLKLAIFVLFYKNDACDAKETFRPISLLSISNYLRRVA